MPKPKLLPVERIDRQAAAAVIRRHLATGALNGNLGTAMDANIVIMAGKGDDFWLVQMFAQHRLDALEDAPPCICTPDEGEHAPYCLAAG